jgi:hypothetical protein
MIEFPFEKRRSQRLGPILKPFIPVRLIGPKNSETMLMLLDSGADLSLIPYSVGEAIGLELDMNNRSEIQGIGEGSVPYILSQVKLGIEEIEIPVRIGWALIEEVPLLLGRLDVFGRFAIEFREFEDKILLKLQQEV